jgi:hypothetical protein
MARPFVFLLLVLSAAQSQQKLSPPVEAPECSAKAPSNELPNARFARKGGRTTASNVLFQGGVLTVKDVAQGRDLGGYETLTLTNPEPRTVLERRGDPITLSSVDATSTSHIFVEQDDTGRWRVSWRIVRYMGEVDDLPTYYSIQWVTPTGFRQPGKPLPERQQPDAAKNTLEFRDKCGEVESSL